MTILLISLTLLSFACALAPHSLAECCARAKRCAELIVDFHVFPKVTFRNKRNLHRIQEGEVTLRKQVSDEELAMSQVSFKVKDSNGINAKQLL